MTSYNGAGTISGERADGKRLTGVSPPGAAPCVARLLHGIHANTRKDK